jgi:hypothetical protein
MGSRNIGGGNDYWVSPGDDGRWRLQREGTKRASAVFERQRDAIQRGRELASHAHSELIIQGTDGRIRAKDSHGNDPRSSRG